MHSESGGASLTGLSSSVASRGYGNRALPDGFFEAVLGFVAIAAAAFSHGGYYPTAWGWFAVVALLAYSSPSRAPARLPGGSRGCLDLGVRGCRVLDCRVGRLGHPGADDSRGRAGSPLRRCLRCSMCRAHPRRATCARQRALGRGFRRMRLRVAHASLPGTLERRRSARRQPALRAARILERARRVRSYRNAARRRARRPCLHEGRPHDHRGIASPALLDALLHLQPGRLDCTGSWILRRDRSRSTPPPARDERAGARTCRGSHAGRCVPISGTEPDRRLVGGRSPSGSSAGGGHGRSDGAERAWRARSCTGWSDALRTIAGFAGHTRPLSLPGASRRCSSCSWSSGARRRSFRGHTTPSPLRLQSFTDA